MSSIKSALPYCPSCFDWEVDARRSLDKGSGDIYGFASHDSLGTLRTKMFILICPCSALPMPIFLVSVCRVAYRIIALLTGDFIRAGRQLALREWELDRQAWSLSIDNAGPLAMPPGKISLYSKIAKHSLILLVEYILKAVTYPLAAVALFFVALYGIVGNPLDARRLFSSIEEFWGRKEVQFDGSLGRMLFQLGECMAPCMQPKRIWEERNLFGFNAPKEDPRSVLRIAKYMLINNREFYTNELSSDSVTKLLNQLEAYATEMRDLKDAANTSRKAYLEAQMLADPANEVSKAAVAELNTKHLAAETQYRERSNNQLKPLFEDIIGKFKALKEARDNFIKQQMNFVQTAPQYPTDYHTCKDALSEAVLKVQALVPVG